MLDCQPDSAGEAPSQEMKGSAVGDSFSMIENPMKEICSLSRRHLSGLSKNVPDEVRNTLQSDVAGHTEQVVDRPLKSLGVCCKVSWQIHGEEILHNDSALPPPLGSVTFPILTGGNRCIELKSHHTPLPGQACGHLPKHQV